MTEENEEDDTPHLEHPSPPDIHFPTVQNWVVMSQGFVDKSMCIVRASDSKGLVYNVICKVGQMPPNRRHHCYYSPVGLMISRDLMPLMNDIRPPRTLKCFWSWPPDALQRELRSTE